MIEIKNLHKSFKNKKVLKDINLKIEEGKIFGLIGINGSGKSTLLRLIAGVYKQDEGTILCDNKVIYENEQVKNLIFFLPDDPYFDTNSTPKSLIALYKTYYDFDEKEYLNYLKNFNLELDSCLKNFSKGMRRQVFVSLALSIKPKYLLLDEAFDGLDPLARLSFKRAIIDLVEDNNTTIIISSHSLRELEDICDSYGLIDHQQITSYGDIRESINKIHKYQIAFKETPNKEKFKNINFITYSQENRIIKIVIEENLENIKELFKPFNPLLIDEINIDFEELFIIEVERRGYLHD